MRQLSTQEEESSYLKKLLQRKPVVMYLLEDLALKLASRILICAKVDVAKLKEMYHVRKDKIRIIPNRTRSPLQEVVSLDFRRPTVVFVGAFDHLPNVWSARLLIEDIIPRVSQAVNDVPFIIVGRNPPKWLREVSHGNVLVAGEVPDVRPYIASANVAVAPTYHGSGTRLKILEYMEAGTPIVSTSNGVHLLVRDDPIEFAEAIIDLLRPGRDSFELVSNSRTLAARNTVGT